MIFDPMALVVALDRDGKAHGSLYVDDGDSFDYQEKGAFARIEFNANIQETERILELRWEVNGNANLLHENSLKVNKIVLLRPDGHVDLPVDLYLGTNSSHKFNFNH